MITEQETALVRHCIDFALAKGASGIRITLTKSTEDQIATLDGEIDKVTHCADRSISAAIFADGRFGSFSTNRLEEAPLEEFITNAIETVRLLTPDPFRVLPAPERCCKTALTGLELGSYCGEYAGISPEDRRKAALDASMYGKCDFLPEGLKLVSEEGEYSDSEYDVLVIDSQGLYCRHSETSYDYGVELTLEDGNGDKYSDYWWTSSPFRSSFDPSDCSATAIRRAAARVGAGPVESGKYNMVIGCEVSSRLVSPLLNALSAYSIQQGKSFLVGSEGKKIFSSGLTIVDEPWRKGDCCSKLFDSEGVATAPSDIIAGGVISRYFVNTYMSGKLGIPPTIEEAVRPRLLPWAGRTDGSNANATCGTGAPSDRFDLMRLCGSGILVTDFNGGNCNMTTGDFSYGVSGHLFRDGKIVAPVSEMLITGNFIELWNKLTAAGSDYRECASKQVPSLAFAGVDFSGE